MAITLADDTDVPTLVQVRARASRHLSWPILKAPTSLRSGASIYNVGHNRLSSFHANAASCIFTHIFYMIPSEERHAQSIWSTWSLAVLYWLCKNMRKNTDNFNHSWGSIVLANRKPFFVLSLFFVLLIDHLTTIILCHQYSMERHAVFRLRKYDPVEGVINHTRLIRYFMSFIRYDKACIIRNAISRIWWMTTGTWWFSLGSWLSF